MVLRRFWKKGIAGKKNKFRRNTSLQYDLEKFFTLSLDMLCIASMDGYFKLVNLSFKRILGWSMEELLAKPFLDFVRPEDVSSTLREMEKLSEDVPTISFENRYLCNDGSYRHSQVLALIRRSGRDSYLMIECVRF